MIATFETESRGRIECDSRKALAYFFAQDYEAPIARDNTFRDYFGTPFVIHWPNTFGKHPTAASLDIIQPRTLAAGPAFIS